MTMLMASSTAIAIEVIKITLAYDFIALNMFYQQITTIKTR